MSGSRSRHVWQALWKAGQRQAGVGLSVGPSIRTAEDMTAGSFRSGSVFMHSARTQFPASVEKLMRFAQVDICKGAATKRSFMSHSFMVDGRAVMSRAAMTGNGVNASSISRPMRTFRIAEPIKQARQTRQTRPEVQGRQNRFYSLAPRRLQQASKAGESAAATAEMPAVGGYVGWYLRMLQEKPVLTKCLTAGGILTTADATTQILTIEGELPPLSEAPMVFDYPRLARMAAMGLFLWGPTLHLWYGLMARILPGTDLLSSIKKMALGQVSYGPAFTAVFFSVNGAAQGETVHEIGMRLKRDLLPTLLKGLCYWPFCDIINFRYVPLPLQPLGNNCAALLWNVYVTYVASQGKVD